MVARHRAGESPHSAILIPIEDTGCLVTYTLWHLGEAGGTRAEIMRASGLHSGQVLWGRRWAQARGWVALRAGSAANGRFVRFVATPFGVESIQDWVSRLPRE